MPTSSMIHFENTKLKATLRLYLLLAAFIIRFADEIQKKKTANFDSRNLKHSVKWLTAGVTWVWFKGPIMVLREPTPFP